MGNLTNSEDQDEMPHDVAFHQGMHCLLRQKINRERSIFLEIITFDPIINTMDLPDFYGNACAKFL